MVTVSVIIPNYNHEKYLTQRIESILSQSFDDYEIILLDDCSTDNSRQIIEHYRTHKKVSHVIYNDYNSGSTFYQWEKGLKLSKGKYIWIAESDDFCEHTILKTLVDNIERKETIGLSYCKTIRVDEEGKHIDDLSFWYEEYRTKRWMGDYFNIGKNEINSFLVFKNTIPNASAVLFKKGAVNFDLKELYEFKLCGDWYFWIQILSNSDITYSSKSVNFFRTHNKSVRTRTVDASILENEKFLISRMLISKKLRPLKSSRQIKSSPILILLRRLKKRF